MGIGAGQGGEMAFEIKARHVGIGLGPQPRRMEAARRRDVEEGQPPGFQQIVDQGGDEHGLARPPQSGDAHAHRRFQKKPAAGIVQAVQVGNAHGRSFTSGRGPALYGVGQARCEGPGCEGAPDATFGTA